MNSDFSRFFHEATYEEKYKLLKEVVKLANQDQSDLLTNNQDNEESFTNR